jgi:hypothetical protein
MQLLKRELSHDQEREAADDSDRLVKRRSSRVEKA